MPIVTDDKIITYKDLRKVLEEINKRYTTPELVLNKMYPKGSVILTHENVNPSTYIGGTWELISQGRALFGVDGNDTDFNTSGKTGGGKTSVAKFMIGWNNSEGNFLATKLVGTPYWSDSLNITNFTPYGTTSKNRSNGIEVVTRSASNTLNNNSLPPYYTVYAWRRTDDGTLVMDFKNLSFNSDDFTVSNNTVSLKNSGGASYTAGPGIGITNNEISFNASTISGYDAGQSQVLKNVNGTTVWDAAGGGGSSAAWEYQGTLNYTTGSTLTLIRSDWAEMMMILSVKEGTEVLNHPNIFPRAVFTYNNAASVLFTMNYGIWNDTRNYAWRGRITYDATTRTIRMGANNITNTWTEQPCAIYVRG